MQDNTTQAPRRARSASAGRHASTSRKGRASKGKKTPAKRPLTPKKIAWRAGLSVLTALALVLVAALGAGFIAFKGPSRSLGDLLTVSMLETSALKFVPRIYYSKAEVDAIKARNEVGELEEETDTSMIVIAGPTPEPGNEDAAPVATPKPENLIVEENGLQIFEVHGPTYNGWIMVVQDPSRVAVGVCRENFNSKPGLVLHEIAARYNAIAAINGGGFSDEGGLGNGGRPIGLVISNGEVLNKASINSDHNIVMGFDQDDKLVIGKMTSDEAVSKGLRDALAFGPALVVNGEPAKFSGSSSGLNPRTAIGQRRDGAVLLLVIDGRQASSLGATYADMINVLMEYEAFNAANLDGGSSSMLWYNGEYINKGVILTGSRELPTAFIVR
ncbi:MAG: phosphodiester glycosidase family protein [Clostridia bacterium]|nr:phosphodiester glycosidase family protein [Clostridia bacterium]